MSEIEQLHLLANKIRARFVIEYNNEKNTFFLKITPTNESSAMTTVLQDVHNLKLKQAVKHLFDLYGLDLPKHNDL